MAKAKRKISSSTDNLPYQQIVTTTYLGKGSVLRGKISFTDSVTIQGNYEGEIHTSGFLYIEDGATVKADIIANTVVIGGVVHGNIEATESVGMLATCKVYGNVNTGVLHIADGVVFEGKCKMIEKSEELDIFAEPPEQLRERFQKNS